MAIGISHQLKVAASVGTISWRAVMTRAAGKRKDSSGDERVAVDGNVIRKAEKSAPRCFYVRFVLMTRLLMFALLQSLATVLDAQDIQQLQDAVRSHIGSSENEPPKFQHAFTDLDGDGVPDAVVLMEGADWCGSGGCNMFVFRGTQSGFTFISSSTITSQPIRVSAEKNFGWKTLIVSSQGTRDVFMMGRDIH
jgi:hypothetical protein